MVDSHLRRAVVAVTLVALETAAILGGISLADRDEPAAKAVAITPTTPKPFNPRTAITKEVGRPERLTIRSIGVDAPIVPVGTTAAGAQDVPTSIDDTGWWHDGVQPGRSGNAVVVGHTASSADGVFDELGKVSRGDALTVRSRRGTLHYDVTRVLNVKVAAFGRISPLVYRSGGRAGLVLMTCGDWNGKNYESTTIVFSTLTAK